jgi:hypothetical protein
VDDPARHASGQGGVAHHLGSVHRLVKKALGYKDYNAVEQDDFRPTTASRSIIIATGSLRVTPWATSSVTATGPNRFIGPSMHRGGASRISNMTSLSS